MIYAGSKIMTFSIREGLNIRFIDSLNFLPMRLANFPKTFGITEMKKGYYPHYFNTAENEIYVGEMPPIDDFGCNSMGTNDRGNFIQWYNKKKRENYVWDNKKELIEYCISDVDILMKSMKIFRDLYIEVAGIDPLSYTTIASVCMAIFRYKYILPDFPELLKKHKEEIKEFKEDPNSKIEVDLKEKFKEDIRDIAFQEKKIAIMPYDDQQFVRDSFFGGRTNANCLKYKFTGDEVGRYADITSLYPTTNYYDYYGKGHLVKIPYDEIDSNTMTKVKNGDYVGFIKCKVIPPKKLYFPVLPEKQKKEKQTKLVFDLTNKVGTWTTMELNKAIELGYEIEDIFEIRYYEETQTDLFKGYVNDFLKIKQESSGFPAWVSCEDDKDKYINNYFKLQGIKLDKEKIKKNPGLRAIAKLCLNSLWGKFGMRLDMPTTEITDSKSKFNNIIFNEKYSNQQVNFIDDRRVEITYKTKDEHIKLNPATNIGIASFTTSHARLRLYQGLEKLQDQVLYNDTDSIVYRYDKNNINHKELPLSDALGGWTDECEGLDIIGTFVSGGPKNYSYQTSDGEYHTKIKGFNLHYNNAKTLNHQGMIEIINNRNKEKEQNQLVVSNFRISRTNQKQLISENEIKKYSFGYDKRYILPEDENGNIFTLPFGHINIK